MDSLIYYLTKEVVRRMGVVKGRSVVLKVRKAMLCTGTIFLLAPVVACDVYSHLGEDSRTGRERVTKAHGSWVGGHPSDKETKRKREREGG